MTLREDRAEEISGDRDIVSAWILVALLAVGLVAVPAFESAVADGVQLIAQLH